MIMAMAQVILLAQGFNYTVFIQLGLLMLVFFSSVYNVLIIKNASYFVSSIVRYSSVYVVFFAFPMLRMWVL